MKIGQLVKYYIPKIIKYCEEENKEEIERLQDKIYSKQLFGIGWSFWLPIENIEESKRFWSNEYQINNKIFRASSQWFSQNMQLFIDYLIDKEIATEEEIEELEVELERKENNAIEKRITTSSRYKSIAIGNAQNLLIRNILSNLGDESFNKNDWDETKNFFDNCCAYCSASDQKLIMEHAIPINKNMLGEHRLGNIVPSCNSCNSKKGSKSYKEFIEDQSKIDKIEEYMKKNNYTPLFNSPNSEIISELLDKAYSDTADVSIRYIQIIEMIQKKV